MLLENLYNKEKVIKHIHAIGALLKSELEYDPYNSEHIVKFLDKRRCLDCLHDCVLSKYCKSIYTQFLYPIYTYLEFTNNWLNIESFNAYMQEDMQKYVNNGKILLDEINY